MPCSLPRSNNDPNHKQKKINKKEYRDGDKGRGKSEVVLLVKNFLSQKEEDGFFERGKKIGKFAVLGQKAHSKCNHLRIEESGFQPWPG